MRISPISPISPMAPYEALIFGCDDSLASILPFPSKTCSESLQTTGLNISKGRYCQYGGISYDMPQILRGSWNCPFDSELFFATRNNQYRLLLGIVKEMEAVAEIVRNHYRKVPIAVASGMRRELLDLTLKKIKLYSLFDVIVSIDDAEFGKPQPDLFLLASQRLGVAPQDCIVYEDNGEGLEAACRAQMRVIDVHDILPKF
jgi:beta-phosphoglucomutase-like phosphatase (HAD superfamily)